jgi:glycine dehydrogenase subunit 2
MAGLDAVTIKTTSEGDIDIADLKEKVSKETAVLMLTLPSTLGLFEPNILEITQIIHDHGGLVYADGANLNALLGITKFGDLGIDICHSNLHKTFSTPHGGGGPGAGPVMVTKKLESFLPYPHIKKEKGNFINYKPVNKIGRLNGFSGSFGILLRAYTYIRSLGSGGLKEISENAIINANYIQERLKSHYNLTSSRYCMHETVLSATRQKENGIKALDIAKKLLDEGFHAPTMYFPLIVDEALMIEPTESESKETIDSFIECMIMISELSSNNPEEIINAPINLPVERLDEAMAARNPVLSWRKE